MQISNPTTELTIKSAQAHNVIEGYASVFGIVDKHNDIIAKGAFRSSISNNVKLLWQHDATQPLGIVTLLAEDEYGLKIEAEINHKTQSGSDVINLIKQKAISGLSIGFNIRDATYDQDGYRIITDLELIEVSIVTFPANNMATIKQIKAEHDVNLIMKLENLINQLIKL